MKRVVPITLIATLCLGSCQRQVLNTDEPQRKAGDLQFSRAEHKAAETLALTGGAAPDPGDALGAAVSCEAAVAILTDRLLKSASLNAEQRTGLQHAGLMLQQRTAAVAAQKGLSTADLQRARDDARIEANINTAASLRTGLACLKRLGASPSG